MSVKAIKLLENKECKYIQNFCEVDGDMEIMFRLMATLKPFGIRDNTPKFDIEFPSRN